MVRAALPWGLDSCCGGPVAAGLWLPGAPAVVGLQRLRRPRGCGAAAACSFDLGLGLEGSRFGGSPGATAKSPPPAGDGLVNNLTLARLGRQANGKGSGTEAGGLDQADLIAAGGEFTTLIALYHHTATGFDPDHAGANPAESGRFEHLDHISGLKIQLHVLKGETARQTTDEHTQTRCGEAVRAGVGASPLGTSNAPWRT